MQRIGMIVAAVILIVAAALMAPDALIAQARANPTPIPTALPVGGLWLTMGSGQAFQGECAPYNTPAVYTDGRAWQVVCMPNGGK